VSVEVPDKVAIVVAEKDSSLPAVDYPPYSTTRFRLVPMPDPIRTIEPFRAHLSGLIGQGEEDALIDPSGDFRVHGWLHRPFILTVLRGDQILHVEPIVFQRYVASRDCRDKITIRSP